MEIKYKIIQIKSHKLFISEPDEVDLKKIIINGETSTIIESSDDIRCTFTFDIVTTFRDKKSNEVLIEHTGRTKYAIENLPKAPSDGETFDIPDKFMVLLFSLAHSHARALLASDLQNSIYRDKLFIPIIDPKTILSSEKEKRS